MNSTKIKFYVAPMEGVTGYTFRNVHHDCYPGADAYFTPFLSPNQHHAVNPKEHRDVVQEHNQGVPVIPQVLTNKPELFLWAARELKEVYGYEEVNLNLGCPSKTVVSKGKGSGFLEDTEKLRRFFEEVFAETEKDAALEKEGRRYPRISVKTRLGMQEPEEFGELLHIYNDYPLSELIIHPRIQKEFYSGSPHLDAFAEAVKECGHSLCYNGDIWTVEDYIRIKEQFPSVRKFMLGRGLVANPGLIQEIQEYEAAQGDGREGKKLQAFEETGKKYKSWKKYHDRLLEGYLVQMNGDAGNVLFKMKEQWGFMQRHFPEQERLIKKMVKAGKLMEYEALAERFFSELG